ncbi:hypothetical protein BOW50_06690 [Solemya velum gill symbiont]|uniref:JmjC domain-containing protein n=1 Tax=Solemya velum gill symbiont TaxID=2340 RepID=UPI000997EEF3|nr:cupin domain-containing protein [Solemya velum gill symbiont]OOZ78043.1 hypothetical protein BOW50_06690 [Solemya velum gill symbiont]
MLRLSASISEDYFLGKIWQQSPLLIRNALDTEKIPCKSELYSLAENDAVESRIVRELASAPFWQLEEGPFESGFDKDFGESRWTLLLQDMDKHLPQLTSILHLFHFIPRWRIDDIMISYAADQGSVGPHVDEYDVFLIQAHGQRRWKIDTNAIENDNLLPDIDLRILRQFETEQEWLLEPGDILYLPPGVAHWGVAEGECITASVGFRAPTSHDLLEGWVGHLLETGQAERFSDPQRPIINPQNAAEISPDDIDSLIECLNSAIPQGKEAMAEWLGCYLSEPKPHLYPDLPESDCDLAVIAERGIQRHGFSHLLYRRADNGITLYADGESFQLPLELAEFASMLCNSESLTGNDLAPWLQQETVIELLEALYELGSIVSEPRE